jgi:hypothetical protein
MIKCKLNKVKQQELTMFASKNKEALESSCCVSLCIAMAEKPHTLLGKNLFLPAAKEVMFIMCCEKANN